MLATEQKPATLTEKDFNPPLKRKEAKVPGYWTLEEIIIETEFSKRKIQYDITGRPERNRLPILKSYKAGPIFLIPEQDALEYIYKYRRTGQ